MKKMLMFLLITLMSVNFVAVASTKTSANLVIEQTISFEDSSSDVIIYYVKIGETYKVFSETNLDEQSPSKLLKVKDTNFKKRTSYKGKCFITCNSKKEVLDLAITLYNKYKQYIL